MNNISPKPYPHHRKGSILSYYDTLQKSKSRSKSRPKGNIANISTISKHQNSVSSKSQISITSTSKNSVFVTRFNDVKNLVKEIEEEPEENFLKKKDKKRFSYFGSNKNERHSSRKRKLNQLKNMMKAELDKVNKKDIESFNSVVADEPKVEKLTKDIHFLLNFEKKEILQDKENFTNFNDFKKVKKR